MGGAVDGLSLPLKATARRTMRTTAPPIPPAIQGAADFREEPFVRRLEFD
jgi:hypothetical protein